MQYNIGRTCGISAMPRAFVKAQRLLLILNIAAPDLPGGWSSLGFISNWAR